MFKFTWSEEYSVGIPSIDEQHKDFFNLANKIIDVLNSDKISKKELSPLIKKLYEHGFEHFATEEKYFDTYQYNLTNLHVDAHNWYRKKVKYFSRRLLDPSVDLKVLADEIATYSIYWLSDHILIMDKKYTKFFQEKGIK